MFEVGLLLIAFGATVALFALSLNGHEQFAPRAILASPGSVSVRCAVLTALTGIAILTTYWIGLALIPALTWEGVVQAHGWRARRARD